MKKMTMNLRRLRHAVVLARMLNFTKAADTLNITQSALSKSIQTLEAECQMRLFDRDRGSVTMTPIGRNFIRRAEALLREEADLSSMIHHASKAEGGEIAIGMPPGAVQSLLVGMLSDMVEVPGFHAKIRIGGPQNLLALLLNEEIDFCVSPKQQLPARSPIRGFVVGHYPVTLLVRAQHPLTRLSAVSQDDVEQYPILMTEASENVDPNRSFFTMHLNVRPAVEVEDYNVLLRLAMATDAVCMSSPIAAMDAIRDGSVVALPYDWLSSRSKVDLMVYYLRRRSLSPVSRRLIDQLREITKNWDFAPSSFATT